MEKKKNFVITCETIDGGREYTLVLGTVENISGILVGFHKTTNANPKWVATHIPSGLRICKKGKYQGFDTKEKCLAYVKRLKPEIEERLHSEYVKEETKNLAMYMRKHKSLLSESLI